jgi:hypothetical protein
LKRLNVKEQKQKLEEKFREWVDTDEKRKEKYGNVLSDIKLAAESRRSYENSLNYIVESMYISFELLTLAYKTTDFISYLDPEENDSATIADAYTDIREYAAEFFKNYNVNLDKEVAAAMFKLYLKNNPPENLPYFYKEIATKYKGDIDKYVDKMYKKSFMTDEEKYNDFLNDPDIKKLRKDMAFTTMISIVSKYHQIDEEESSYDDQLDRARRLYMEGLMEMQSDKTFYSDANFTMRMTYGTVEDYYPRDAVHYNYYTTLKGVMEKKDNDNYEFAVADRLVDLYKEKDWGGYTTTTYMPVCFITNNDITGGNSGSPVINANGELIGLAFDGNWEAMSGDIAYEPELQRCICVDIRYVLFIIDKFAGARHLIDEMTLVK